MHGDELLPVLQGTGRVPETASPLWPSEVMALYQALVSLSGRGTTPPTDAEILDATAVVDRPRVYQALSRLRRRAALVHAMQTITEQLERGVYDPGAVAAAVTRHALPDPPVPLAQKLASGDIRPPRGLSVGFPSIQSATGGLIGLWVIGGETGVGKSTFALQVACTIARRYPVLYYDAENGEEVLAHHLQVAHRGTSDWSFTDRLYIRSSVATLETDVRLFPPPALLVVDSVQKFGYELGGKSYREAINALIRRVELLKRSGYSVILVSEIARASYGQVSNAGYAETRELEFSADLAAQLVLTDDGAVEFHITKNRHRPHRGFVVGLTRDTDWSFQEDQVESFEDGPRV